MAGEVVIVGDFVPDISGKPGAYRMLWGTVVLDGGNPTPINLAGYLRSVDMAIVSMEGAGAPADDPNYVTSAVAAAVVNVYAWKNTNGTDPTYTASADNSRLVNWFAIGPK